jgi:carbon-monoxide dehydrogenase medium subunit
VIPVAFEYVAAESVEHAVELLAEHGDEAKLLAGGHSLLPMMKLRLATPAVLIDIGRVAALSYIRSAGEHVAIGAGTRHDDLLRSEVLAREVPLLPLVAGHVGDPQIRNRGTLGGSLAHADPAADLPSAALALDATLVIRGPAGEREVPIGEFYLGYFETVLQPDELIVEVRVPQPASPAFAYRRFVRRANDWAIVAVAVSDGRVAMAHMASTPVRAAATEAALRAGASVEAAAALAAEGCEPIEDMHADREYRCHLARLLTRRALSTAAG